MIAKQLPNTCHGAFPLDPSFPQLTVAGDPARMLEVFRAHLTALPGKDPQILDCRPFRFRCRQSSKRCVLQYTLRVLEASTGRQWDQWVTGILYSDAGEGRRLWEALREGDGVAEIPEPWRCFRPVGFIPELDMVVEVFPFDRRLPQLGQVLNGATRDLEPLLLSRLEGGRWRAGAGAIEPARYRTELGAVFRYALPAREEGSGRERALGCYVKVYRNDQGRATYEFLRSWWEGHRGQERGYTLVRPLAYWSELRTLVLEEVEGTSLRETLLTEADPSGAVRAAARAVAAFNQDPLPIARHYSSTHHGKDLKLAASLVQWACPEKRAKIGGVSAVVAQGLSDVPPATIHRDLTPEHVLLSGGRVTFVDTDSVSLGDPVRDPALMFAHMVGTLSMNAVAPERALAIAGTFVEEYFAQVPSSWRPRFRLHCAGALIEVAAGVFRSQVPGWRDKVAEMVSNARHALAGEFG